MGCFYLFQPVLRVNPGNIGKEVEYSSNLHQVRATATMLLECSSEQSSHPTRRMTWRLVVVDGVRAR
eukprot:2906830-Rhodomonas_salina.1